jgi:imidazolonepropionase-like amidohydrolase/Tol biopolymer transport system component
MSARAAVLIGSLAALSCGAAEPPLLAAHVNLAITGVTLIDGTGAPPRAGTTILIQDGRIVAVVADGEARIPAHATVIDGAGKYVIPGLVDLHAHGTSDAALAQYLFYGVTSVLQLGGTGASTDAIRDLRARRASGTLEAPYIFGTGGHLTLHGTHPIYTLFPPSIREAADSIAAATPLQEPANLYPLGIGVSFVRTVEAARKAVQERAAGGMDAIKITVESGPRPFGEHRPRMPVEMIREIVDEAARHGLPVFAHISSVPELEAAVRGGASTLAHAVGDEPEPGPEHVRMLAEGGVSVTPTLAFFYALHRYMDDPTLLDDPFLRAGVTGEAIESARQAPLFRMEGLPDFMRQRLLGALRHVGEAHRAGVTIALGTDAAPNFVNFPGFSAHVEMQLLAKAGLTPMEVIEAATRRGAELLRRADEFGTVEPGKRADLLILGANPLDDIRNTRSIEVVVSEGRVVDRRALLADVVTGGPGAAPGDAVGRQCGFGAVENLGPAANSSFFDGSPTVSADERTLIFTSERMEGRQDLFTSTRRRTEDPWGEAVSLGRTVNHPVAHDFSVRLSQDARSLYFASERPGGFGSSDLYVARRASPGHPWEPPENLGPGINTGAFEAFPTPSADGNTLYFNRSTTWDSPDSDIWVTTRANEYEPWGAPERLPEPVRGPGSDFAPAISADGLTLYFASRDRPGNIGLVDIWAVRRPSESAPWGAPENLRTPVNTPQSVAMAPFPSIDGRRLYFMSSRPGGLGGADCDFWDCFDLYVATRTCGDKRREE